MFSYELLFAFTDNPNFHNNALILELEASFSSHTFRLATHEMIYRVVIPLFTMYEVLQNNELNLRSAGSALAFTFNYSDG